MVEVSPRPGLLELYTADASVLPMQVYELAYKDTLLKSAKMRNQIFATGEYYHIYNRGTDRRKMFLVTGDYERFISGMKIFNSTNRVTHAFRGQLVEVSPRPEERLVNVVAYCLMNNHFHLLLEQVSDDGISKYLQKLLTGYTMYFNKRYDRSGVLCQGVFKSRHIDSNAYLLHLSRYIHLNPLKIGTSNIDNRDEADRALGRYRWSSYGEYTEKSSPAAVTEGIKVIRDQVGGAKNYEKFCLSAIGRDYDWSRFRLDQE